MAEQLREVKSSSASRSCSPPGIAATGRCRPARTRSLVEQPGARDAQGDPELVDRLGGDLDMKTGLIAREPQWRVAAYDLDPIYPRAGKPSRGI